MKILAKIGIIVLCIGLLGVVNAFAQKPNMELLVKNFWDMDTNKDGVVSPEEIEAYANKAFSEMDKDTNNYLDSEEMNMDEPGLFAGADTDQDTMVSKEEALAQVNKNFQKMDTNQDNVVSEAEYEAFWKNVMENK